MKDEFRTDCVFQFMDHLPFYEFQKCVERYRGDAHHRGFSCRDQYLAMAFAQLTYRESLRDIEACHGSMRGKLYHMGFRGRVTRSTLADANESHHLHIFADFSLVLIGIARPLYSSDPMGVGPGSKPVALDYRATNEREQGFLTLLVQLCNQIDRVAIKPYLPSGKRLAPPPIPEVVDEWVDLMYPTFDIAQKLGIDPNTLAWARESTVATSTAKGTAEIILMPESSGKLKQFRVRTSPESLILVRRLPPR